MLLIAPPDYERYTVAHSPLLVPADVHAAISGPSRQTDPIDPQLTKSFRRKFPPGDWPNLAARGMANARRAASSGRTTPSLSISLSVELSSIAGISLENLAAERAKIRTSVEAAARQYEKPAKPVSPTLNLIA